MSSQSWADRTFDVIDFVSDSGSYSHAEEAFANIDFIPLTSFSDVGLVVIISGDRGDLRVRGPQVAEKTLEDTKLVYQPIQRLVGTPGYFLASATGVTPVWTCPAGRTARIIGLLVSVLDLVGSPSAPTVNYGFTGASYLDVISGSTAALTAAGKGQLLLPAGPIFTAAAGAVLNANVTVAANAPLSLQVEPIGYWVR